MGMNEKIRVCDLKVNDIFQKMFSTYVVKRIEGGKLFYQLMIFGGGIKFGGNGGYMGANSKEWVLLVGNRVFEKTPPTKHKSIVAFDLNGNKICECKTMTEMDNKLSLYRGYTAHWFRRKNMRGSKYKFVKKK